MNITDRVYGTFQIHEPVLLELLEHPVLRRIQRINQYGIPDDYFYVYNFSRYEHSVGVMMLLQKLGASLEEQIAGLLHDVSHTAFSHTFDWVIGTDGKEEFADSKHREYLLKTGINTVVEKYGYDFERIADCHHYSLLEQPIPDLCADRVDYSLRELMFNRPPEEMEHALQHFIAHNGQIVCKNADSALWFAQAFLWLQKNRWGSKEGVSRYRWFAKALKFGIEDQTITLEDFWQDDEFVIQKLETSTNPKVQKILTTLKQDSLSNLPLSPQKTTKKFRHVDPLFLKDEKLVRLSEENEAFRHTLETARQENTTGMHCFSIEL